MNENNQLINDPRKRTEIFHSLMAVELHSSGTKTQQEILEEQKKAEDQGQLRIYYPEVK